MAGKHRTRQHRALQRVLRSMRKKRQLTQSELAARLRKPQSFVSKIETGERELGLPELGAVTEALGYSLETLIRLYKKELE